MNYPHYKDIEISADCTTFDFISIGPKGHIHKNMTFRPIIGSHVYNLAFGDVVYAGINDYSISDNKDMPMVLSTIAYAIDQFLKNYPEKYVFFRGSTVERTRLYRMAIGNNLEYLLNTFAIWSIDSQGLINPFEKNCNSSGFLIQKRFINLIS